MREGEKPHFESVSEVTSRISLLSLALTFASSQGPEVSSQRGVGSSWTPGTPAVLCQGVPPEGGCAQESHLTQVLSVRNRRSQLPVGRKTPSSNLGPSPSPCTAGVPRPQAPHIRHCQAAPRAWWQSQLLCCVRWVSQLWFPHASNSPLPP